MRDTFFPFFCVFFFYLLPYLIFPMSFTFSALRKGSSAYRSNFHSLLFAPFWLLGTLIQHSRLILPPPAFPAKIQSNAASRLPHSNSSLTGADLSGKIILAPYCSACSLASAHALNVERTTQLASQPIYSLALCALLSRTAVNYLLHPQFKGTPIFS